MPTLILGISGARGIVDDGFDEGVAARLAAAFLGVVGVGPVVLGRDSRPSGPRLAAAVTTLLEREGARVHDLGVVPTPTVQVAVESLPARGGIVVTASHNPPAWNALKFVGPAGTFLDATAMAQLLADFHQQAEVEGPAARSIGAPRDAPRSGDADGVTTVAGQAAIAEHIERVCATVDLERIRAAGLRVVIDGVHGAGSVLIDPLLKKLGVAVVWVAGEPNGRLPEHPEPRAERLGPLRERVAREEADAGFALDPDGDRCALVLPQRLLGEEWTLPLCAVARLESGRRRGPLVVNLSTSAMIDEVGARYDVPIERTPVGEAHVVTRARAIGALLAGEGNGGVIDPAVHWGRDAAVAIALLLDLAARDREPHQGLVRQAGRLTPRIMRKETLQIERDRFAELARRLRVVWGAPASDADGQKWIAGDSWLHLRLSNTEPIARVIAEARHDGEAADWIGRLRDVLEEL